MASNLIAMASELTNNGLEPTQLANNDLEPNSGGLPTLLTMASNLIAMASQLTNNGLEPNSDGLPTY